MWMRTEKGRGASPVQHPLERADPWASTAADSAPFLIHKVEPGTGDCPAFNFFAWLGHLICCRKRYLLGHWKTAQFEGRTKLQGIDTSRARSSPSHSKHWAPLVCKGISIPCAALVYPTNGRAGVAHTAQPWFFLQSLPSGSDGPKFTCPTDCFANFPPAGNHVC